MDKKTPPHSIPAEQAVLGALLLDASNFDQVIELLNSDDFYDQGHKIIFDSMLSLKIDGKPIDPVLVLNKIENNENFHGEVYLYEITNSTPSASNVMDYALIVRERSILRKLINVSEDIYSKCCLPCDDIGKLLDYAENMVKKVNIKGLQND